EREQWRWHDRSACSNRPCASEGIRSRARVRLLLRCAGLRIDAALRNAGCVRGGRRVSSPHRVKHLGKRRRECARSRHDGAVPSRRALSHACRIGSCAEAADRCEHPARRRERSRGERSALPARPRSQRRRALLGSPAGQVAARCEWRRRHVHTSLGSRRFAARGL
ncbi:MAG: Glyoxalase family protein, partial [uncultured Chthoniobacterales bacterium]